MTVKCWKCGKTIEKPTLVDLIPQEIINSMENLEQYLPVDCDTPMMGRRYCGSCGAEVEKEYKEDLHEYLRLKSKLMVNRAIRMLESQNVDFYDYEEAIKVVSEYAAENPEKFMSAHEALTAIILIYNEVETKVQFKIKNHQVDFCLPQLKIILEIDGYMHDHSKLKDSHRDIEIRQILGEDWEVVRIPTKYVEQNVKVLVDAIEAIKSEKQKMRAENFGVMPDWFSKKKV